VYSNKNQDSHLSPYHNATKELRIRFKRAVQAHDRSRNRKERESSEQKETRETGSVQREPVYLNVRDNSYDSRDAHFLKSRPFLLNNKPREPRARYVVNRSKDLLNNSKEGIVVIDSTCRDINMSKDSFIAAHPGSR
jgi:TPP-dependent 2-oxoacid decarboxylase